MNRENKNGGHNGEISLGSDADERERERERQRETERDRERQRETERDRDRDTERERERQTDRQTDRQADRQTGRQTDTDREEEEEADRHTNRQKDGDGLTNKERGRQTNTRIKGRQTKIICNTQSTAKIINMEKHKINQITSHTSRNTSLSRSEENWGEMKRNEPGRQQRKGEFPVAAKACETIVCPTPS